MYNLINRGEKKLYTLLKNNNISKRAIKEAISSGEIYLNGKQVFKNLSIVPEDKINLYIKNEELDYQPIKGDINIVYEDDSILIVNKQKGITVNSKNQISLANFLAFYFLKSEIKSKVRFINRLDMGTSGLLMVAKHRYAQSYYQKQIENNEFTKIYRARVKGFFDKPGQYDLYLSYDSESKKYRVSKEGKLSRTILSLENYDGVYSDIKCQIITGKTHQIRVTLAYLGFPIVGDGLYGFSENSEKGFFLHSSYLKFKKMENGKIIEIKA